MEIDNQNYLDELVNSSIQNIKDLAKTNTIIGEPILSPSGSVIIPISKVSVGFVVGGGQYNSISKKQPYPMAGGSGGGITLAPIGFIVESKDGVKFVDTENKNAYQTAINLVNTLINKFGEKNEKN